MAGPGTDVRNLTVAFGLRAFATGLVNVFLPLLMLQRGAGLSQICLFYVAYSVVKLLIEYPSFISIERRSLAFGVSATLGATVIYLLLIFAYINGAHGWAIALAPAAQAVVNSYLWNTQHIYLSRAISAPRLARDMARLNVVVRFAMLTGPPVGGALAEFAGQRILIVVAISMSLLAVLPVWWIGSLPRAHVTEKVRLSPALSRDLLANLAFNAHGTLNICLWPLYLAIVIGRFAGIGMVTATIDVISLLLMFVAGRRSDNGATHRVLLEGTVATTIGYTIRIFATTPLTIALIGGVANTAILYQLVPWTTTYYEHARRYGARYILWMEFAGDAGSLLVWTLLLSFTYTTSSDHTFFVLAFLLAAVCCTGSLLINRRPSTEGDLDGLDEASRREFSNR
jgi:hypothetical protein